MGETRAGKGFTLPGGNADLDRVRRFIEARAQGRTLTDIGAAETPPISGPRVQQIIAKYGDRIVPAADKASARAVELTFLDDIRRRLLAVMDSPAPPAFDQRGNPLIDPDTGRVVRDIAGHMTAIGHAIKAHGAVVKMLGLAEPTEIIVRDDEANAAARAEAEAAMALIDGD